MDLSNFYLDIIKDRLYCEKCGSRLRRSAQSAMYEILSAMVRLIAPILAFTSNEIWLAMKHDKSMNPAHVMLNNMPKPNPAWCFSEAEAARFELLIALRDDVNKALELARNEKTIGKPLDADVTLFVSEQAAPNFAKISDMPLAADFIVSKVTVENAEGSGMDGETFKGVRIKIEPSAAPKCPRCWTHSEHIGQDSEYPELCPRCAAALKD